MPINYPSKLSGLTRGLQRGYQMASQRAEKKVREKMIALDYYNKILAGPHPDEIKQSIWKDNILPILQELDPNAKNLDPAMVWSQELDKNSKAMSQLVDGYMKGEIDANTFKKSYYSYATQKSIVTGKETPTGSAGKLAAVGEQQAKQRQALKTLPQIPTERQAQAKQTIAEGGDIGKLLAPSTVTGKGSLIGAKLSAGDYGDPDSKAARDKALAAFNIEKGSSDAKLMEKYLDIQTKLAKLKTPTEMEALFASISGKSITSISPEEFANLQATGALTLLLVTEQMSPEIKAKLFQSQKQDRLNLGL